MVEVVLLPLIHLNYTEQPPIGDIDEREGGLLRKLIELIEITVCFGGVYSFLLPYHVVHFSRICCHD